jgi:hypothetical protein
MGATASSSAPPAIEHRTSTRYPASDVPSIKGLRLSPHGAEARLVNISVTGLLAECTVRLKVGSAVTVLFEGGFVPVSAAGRVARCEVSAMGRDGVLRYHVGIAFKVPIESNDVPPPMPAGRHDAAALAGEELAALIDPATPANAATASAAAAASPHRSEVVAIDLESLIAPPPPVRNRW